MTKNVIYRSVKGVVGNLVEALETERDQLAREVERLTLHGDVAQKHIDKLTEQLGQREPSVETVVSSRVTSAVGKGVVDVHGDEVSLLPCPFCGDEDLSIQDARAPDDGLMVYCHGCLSQGPLCESRFTAAMTWNERKQSEPAGDPMFTITPGTPPHIKKIEVSAEALRFGDWFCPCGKQMMRPQCGSCDNDE